MTLGQQIDPRESYKPAAGVIPTEPGVYRFLDRTGKILYIGKAKNLRARINNYFQDLRTLAPRTQRMLQLARNIDWTVVATDTESLILEHTWIGEHQPPFNVQFRDDKSYPSLAITLKDEAPRLIITRNRNISGAKYYGPFPKLWAVKQLTGALQEAFPIRTCNNSDYRRAMRTGKPCLSSQIGKCAGPCSQKISLEEHRKNVNLLIRFMNGADKSLLKELTREMQEAASNYDYEKAASIRDQITGIHHVLEQNAMVLSDSTDLDVFGIAMDDTRAVIQQFVIRGGRIRSEYSWMVHTELDSDPERVLEQAIQKAYLEREVPKEILVSSLPHSLEELSSVLQKQGKLKKPPRINVPVRGAKKQVLERALLNAKEQLLRFVMKRAADIVTRTDALAEIAGALDLSDPPMRIECIDVSHLQGSNQVAALVVFEDGLPKKSDYRSFKIRDAQDDTAAIFEVVSRRAAQLTESIQEVSKEQNGQELPKKTRVPDLFVIDGGLPQANAAHRALKEAGLTHIAVCGLAKRLEELWLPNDQFPIILPRSSDALFLLQRIRDEAHRFAITHQRRTREKVIKTELTDIPGIGSKKSQLLLRHFGSVNRIKTASVDELEAVEGISAVLSQTIYTYFQK